MYHDVSSLLSRLINGPLSLRQIYFASSNGPVPDLAYQVDFPRLEIVQMLSNGEKCGCRLLERFSITQPTLSHHMKILVECGLVNDRKEGKWHHYSLNCETLIEFKDSIGSLTCASCCDKKDSCC